MLLYSKLLLVCSFPEFCCCIFLTHQHEIGGYSLSLVRALNKATLQCEETLADNKLTDVNEIVRTTQEDTRTNR